MTDNTEIIDLLSAMVSTIDSQDAKAQAAKDEIIEKLAVLGSKTDTISTNFPKLIETISKFDNKIASSFENVEKLGEQMDSVISQMGTAEKVIKSLQQQAEALKLSETQSALTSVQHQAQQLKNKITETNNSYAATITETANIALTQIRALRTQVGGIAENFKTIVANEISERVIDNVSSSLSRKLTQKIQTDIETSAGKTAETLANKAFSGFYEKIEETKAQIESDRSDFHKTASDMYFDDIRTLKRHQEELIKIASTSERLFKEREEAYQNHVTQEKRETKIGWLKLLGGAWVVSMVTILLAGTIMNKSSESIVDKALDYKELQKIFSKNGFRGLPKEECQNFMPRQNITQTNTIDFCYFSKKPYHQIETNKGMLNIVTK